MTSKIEMMGPFPMVPVVNKTACFSKGEVISVFNLLSICHFFIQISNFSLSLNIPNFLAEFEPKHISKLFKNFSDFEH